MVRPFDMGKIPIDKATGKRHNYLFMMNHLSNADPYLAVRLFWSPTLPDAKWAIKSALFSIPFGGWCLGNRGDLRVKFTKEKGGWGTEKGSVGAMMQQATGILKRGNPLNVFPEGGRNAHP